jgi:D-glycerate 3-kinase
MQEPQLAPDLVKWLAAYRDVERLPESFAALVEQLHVPMAAAIAGAAKARGGLFVVGLCGAQGSGKSTMVQVLAQLLTGDGLRVAVLSLDDLYCTRAQRQQLAAQVHPLLTTRGPPGTHDVALGMEVITALEQGRQTALPRFDKARDDRRPRAEWAMAGGGAGPVDVLLFEGWCVGARPEPAAALALPVNPLERDEDRDLGWRRHVNAALAGDYATLFARIDRLVMLRAPSFETVKAWRLEQEAKLLAASGAEPGSRVMTEAEVLRFVQFFERTTRQIEREMPARADMLVTLNQQRQVVEWHGIGTGRLVP